MTYEFLLYSEFIINSAGITATKGMFYNIRFFELNKFNKANGK